MVGWLISLLGFIILFLVVGKQQRKGKNVSLLHKILAGILCVHFNGIVSFLLYRPVMAIFNIPTDGFMNMNRPVTITVIWMVLAIIGLLLSSYAKERLGALYRTIRTTQKVFLFLPVTFLIVFLFVASFK